ncbi:hypothetical protein [Streptomyces sp. NBC_00343]|uniref:hypothetical protein n=1 Tax=Streptomyces sp. NBC_00343 TaxID=2975719 RepID=UPI002E2E3F66|nr:hypothetical protein [Streptomyces sp. NBC_00343]
MPRSTWTAGRRGALLGASAAVVCATLTACGNTGDGGYVAVGPPRPSTTAVRPTGSVTLVPLDSPKSPAASGTSGTATTPAPASTPVASSPTGAKSGRSSTRSPSPTPTAAPTTAPVTPVTPAALTWGDPARKATDHRWCEDVTLSFRNSGGTAVRSGTVTFGTHIVGALGIDWATIGSAEPLPVPVAAHAREDHTWTVCVDAWRVPLGMHIETRDVSVVWK